MAKAKSRSTKRQGKSAPGPAKSEVIRSPLSPKKKAIFWAVMVCVPLFFLGGTEFALRLMGFGKSAPLFIPNQSAKEYFLANPEVLQRYTDEKNPLPISIETVFFKKEKPPGSYRIMVQGSSSAAGFPYGVGASPAGMLKQRLQRTFPEKEIEVISVAASAINSYMWLDMADEVIAQKPDAVLIYGGHNEFLGLYGAASALSSGGSHAAKRLAFALRDYRVFQAAQKLYNRCCLTLPSQNTGGRTGQGTLMARISAGQRVPFQSDLYHAGEAQFKSNLTSLLRKYRQAGIEVLIGTLASNERDQSPFVSDLAPQTEANAWNLLAQEVQTALKQGNWAQAQQKAQALIAFDDSAADSHYWLGQAWEGLGDVKQARQAYLAAKDRDHLRFRASEGFNQIIREVAQAQGATVVESQEAFVKASRHGIIGNELMVEHLHPNLNGYFVLADAFYRTMQTKGLIAPWTRVIPPEVARQEVPVTEVDELLGMYKILILKADWPFEKIPKTPVIPTPQTQIERLAHALYQKQINWIEAMQHSLTYYQTSGNWAQAIKVATLLADSFPYLPQPQAVAGQLLQEHGQPEVAAFYWSRAQRLNAPAMKP